MLIDLHANPGQLSPEQLAEKTLDAGLDALVVTQANTTEGVAAYLEALRGEELLAFAGVELPLAEGSVVFIPREANEAFYAASWRPGLRVWDLKGLRERLADEDGAVIISHPYLRVGGGALGDRSYAIKNVTAVEVRVNDGRVGWDHLADHLAHKRDAARLGSCGGDANRLGMAATVVGPDVETQADLVKALTPNQCMPVEFDDPNGTPRDRTVPKAAPREPRRDGGRGGRDGGRGGRDGGRGGRDGGRGGRGGREGGGGGRGRR